MQRLERTERLMVRWLCSVSLKDRIPSMLKAAGDASSIWATDVCNSVVKEGKIPQDWCKSWMVNVYKGKRDALECGSYRGIKLLEHVMKILERVIEGWVKRVVKIDDMQFGFIQEKVPQMIYL